MPGASVSGPSAEAATRRWYEGEVVTLTTASGQEVTVTANHPVLTSRGWIPANLIQEGDDVVRSTRPEGATPLVVPDHQQVPALIEDVWGSFSVNGLHTVPTTAEDFHGDGGQGEVDVVYPDGSLFDGLKSAIDQHVKEHLFASGLGISEGLVRQGVSQLLDLGRAASAGGSVGGSGLSLSLRHGHLLVPDDSGFAHSADLDAAGGEYAADGSAGYPVLHGERVLGRSAFVGGDDFFSGEGERLARWDAPGGPFQLESRDGYASRGLDLLERLTGQVELDRVVKLSRVEWSGHVYNLTSSEGWFSANSLIVSNCDCVHVPARESMQEVRTDPYAYFNSLSRAEQDRLLGANEAQAVRDGADIYRIVNVGNRGASLGKDWTSKLYDTPRVTIDDLLIQSRGNRDRMRELMTEHGFILPQGQVAGGALKGNAGGSPWGYSAGSLGRGGTRRGATDAYREAVRTGKRDPLDPATQTVAENRFHRSYLTREAMLAGRNPFSSSRPLTDRQRALIESDWQSQLATLRNPRTPAQIHTLAALLGVK